jgi:hypothetical protein
MSVLGLATIVLALGIFLWLAGEYLPVDREGRRSPGRSERNAAVPIPILIDRSGTARPRGEVNPPATLRLD